MKILLALSLAILAGCVPARDPQLTAIKQAEDSGLGCEQIAMEYANQHRSRAGQNYQEQFQR